MVLFGYNAKDCKYGFGEIVDDKDCQYSQNLRDHYNFLKI
jgi:hypothetical protein